VVLPRLIARVALEDWTAVAELLPRAREIVEADAIVGPTADQAEGLAGSMEADRAPSLALLRAAVTAFDRIQAPFEAASARESLARVAEPQEARVALESAAATYQELNARPHLARVTEALRDLPIS
jgi:hypothetical protein